MKKPVGMGAGRPGQGPGRPFGPSDAAQYLKRGFDALNRKDFREAIACSQLVLKYMPKMPEAHFLVGLIGIETRDWGTATRAFKNVVALKPDHAAGWAQLARAFVTSGQYANAETAVAKAEGITSDDPLVLDVIGTVHSLLGDQVAALDWYDKAAAKAPNAIFELSRAKALTFLGRLDEAETALNAILKERPTIAQAHWMKSRLKKATDTKHLDEMKALLADVPDVCPPATFLQYAIGKELEDQEDWPGAFAAYAKGAASRRVEVEFEEAKEEAMFGALVEAFNAGWLDAAKQGDEDASPIFIVGQPRTGTTLIERIITAHSDAASAGELQQFAMSIKRLSGVTSPKPMTEEIVRKAATIEPAELGRMYLHTTRTIRPDTPRYVDKMPVNYLYLPLIAAALPNAKIVHVVRDPVDSCFSSFKQLFAEAYYHSYDLEEMARHHVRYRRLMDAWRDLLGDRLLDIAYEDTVENTEKEARRLIEFLGLEWQDACLDFHRQSDAVTTASAAQVREKAHSRSVGLWRHYEAELQPAIKILQDEGII